MGAILKARNIPGPAECGGKLSQLAQIISDRTGLSSQRFSVEPGDTNLKYTFLQQGSITCLRSRTPTLGSRCTQNTLGGRGPICITTNSHSGKCGGKTEGLPMQENHSYSTGVAKHALVLGSSSNLRPDPPVSAQLAQSSDSTIQSDSTQESTELQS